MNRFSSAVLIGIVLYTSENDPSFAAGNGDANANVASTASAEEAAIQAAAYKARLAARAAADEGYFLGRRGDFPAARKKFSQAIELDPKFSPAYRLRADACLKMSDWAGAIADLNTLIRRDPNYAEIFNERGFARRQLGDLQGARNDFDHCIALGTDLPLASTSPKCLGMLATRRAYSRYSTSVVPNRFREGQRSTREFRQPNCDHAVRKTPAWPVALLQ